VLLLLLLLQLLLLLLLRNQLPLAHSAADNTAKTSAKLEQRTHSPNTHCFNSRNSGKSPHTHHA
jgi:hypothetical protein